MYIVMCRVSGGVTGTNEAPLKEQGQIVHFPSKEVAEARAKDLNAAMNNRHSLADFRYRAEEV